MNRLMYSQEIEHIRFSMQKKRGIYNECKYFWFNGLGSLLVQTGQPKKWIPWRSLCVKKTGIGTSPNDRNHYLKMEIIQGLLWFKLICAGLLLQLFLKRLHITVLAQKAQRDATGRAQGDVLCVLQNDLTEINHVWSKMRTGTYTLCAPGCPKCTYMILHVLILPAANGNK